MIFVKRHSRRYCMAMMLGLAGAVFGGYADAYSAPAQTAACETITVSSHSNYPPYSFLEDGVLKGAAIDLIRVIGKDIGVNIDIQNIGPWMRALTTLRKGGIDMLTTVYLVPERLGDLAYTRPYIEDPIVVFTVGDDAPDLHEHTDLINLDGLTTRGESRGEEFDRFMASSLNIMTVNSIEQIIHMLDQGRADYGLQGLYSLKKAERHTSITKKIWITDVPINAAKMCFAFARTSPCTGWIPAINAEIEKRIADGTVTDLMAKYAALAGY
ncbi:MULTISPECIES: substrate-binding periplasmic protein [Thalassospira]|uniref:Solute-binding protein family 3/N-terminal domain-containing protein n=2 Tax=Thalassospira TaxID=168934 RepID=A0A367W5T7_9PROT|nr:MULTISPECIES: transporter substrate-binding domain-containing protein [Thalassospira]MDG4719359.1 transporter substrate-binding domain-containing protein [Thalassospira sp. FZY0004]RCK36805.1 hypothetical protein TH19_12900 [Thalassospira profundimaris]